MTEQIITIKWPSGRYQLYLPKILDKIPLADLRKKVFDWLFKNLWVDPVNEETVAVLDAYIPEWVAEHKQGWADASKVFSNGYRDTKFMNASAKEKSAVKRENDRLYAEVKRQKKAYERSEKVLTAWTDTKTRYQS